MNKGEGSASEPPQAGELRREAEKRLRNRKVRPVEGMAEVDIRALLHELQVHQIELEMQNEELERARAEAEEASEKYCDLFDFAPIAYFLWDIEGRILGANLAGAVLLGLDRSLVVRKLFSQFVAMEHRAPFAEFCRRVLASDVRQSCEVELISDGRSVHALIEGIAARDGQERICRAAVIDISPQKHADELAAVNQALKAEIAARKQAEEEILSLAEFPKENPNPVLRVSGDGQVLYANQPAIRLLVAMGWHASQPLPEQLLRPARGVLEGGGIREFDLLCALGRTFSFAAVASSRAGQINLYARDITERQKAEAAIETAKELSDSLNRINTAIHSTFDIQEIMRRIIVEAAQAFGCETAAISFRRGGGWVVRFVHGFSEEVVGRRLDDADQPHALLALKTMSPVVINDAFHDERVNTEHMKEFGVRSVIVIPLSAGGQPLGVVFFNHHTAAIPFTEAQVDFAHKLASAVSLALDNANQVEERKQAEEALLHLSESLEQRVAERTAELRQSVNLVQAERRRFHEVLDALPVYVILLTPDYHVAFANRFFESRFGKSEGRRCYEYLFQRTEPCETCETYKVLQTNAPHHWEWTGPDGRNYDIRDFPFKDVDGSPLIMEVGMDITERRQDELALAARTVEVQRLADHLRALAVDLSQAEQRERRRLAKILHDHIQQLLVAARMQVEWLKRDSSVERMRATAQGVDGILREALDASRSLTVELSPPVLQEAGLIGGLNWLASRMQEKNQFTVNLHSDSKAEPAGEETRYLLFECVRELLFNTVKHAGVSEAHVALLRTRDDRIKLIIRDEGKGFDPDLLKKRGADQTTFGLFYIQQRLAHIGGEMEIATAPGKGTSITVTIPAGEVKPLTGEKDGTAGGEDGPGTVHVRERKNVCRVLVVDDHKIMREGLVGLMQFEPDIEIVGQAADGPQAIELAAQLQPDMIIMDVNLGEMSGVEATKRILANNPNIKVIGLSMHVDNDLANAMRDAGATAYLTKGGPSQALLDAIRAAR